MKQPNAHSGFVLCMRSEGCDDLEPRKIYRVLSGPGADEEGYLRVIDESGEDYLYPADYFAPIELSEAIVKALETPV